MKNSRMKMSDDKKNNIKEYDKMRKRIAYQKKKQFKNLNNYNSELTWNPTNRFGMIEKPDSYKKFKAEQDKIIE